MKPYEQPDAGGSWEHRSGDCEEHGVNVPFAKPYKSAERAQCVECMLEVARIIAAQEAKYAVQTARRSSK